MPLIITIIAMPDTFSLMFRRHAAAFAAMPLLMPLMLFFAASLMLIFALPRCRR